MSYTPTRWINGEDGHDTPINASNLNKIEAGISDNSSGISQLQGGMRFMGETSTLPNNPRIGEVYQASATGLVYGNKIGDLLVYTKTNSWHVIPSGNEHDGTVTRINQGAGIIVNNGSPLTESGEIKLDTSFVANNTRNGLLSSTLFKKISTLSNVAVTGSWSDLDQSTIPSSAKRPIRDDVDIEASEYPSQTVVSQSGIKTLLDGKADTSHSHLIEDIEVKETSESEPQPLSNYLAKDNNGVTDVLTPAAPKLHPHGNITANGYVMSGDTYAQNQVLLTDSDGRIVPSPTIPSSMLRGYSIYSADGSSSINISTLNSTVGITGDDGLRGAVKNLNTWVGIDETQGLRKDVSTLLEQVGTTDTNGLIKKVSTLESASNTYASKFNILNFSTTGSEKHGEKQGVNRLNLVVPASGVLPAADRVVKLTPPAVPTAIKSTHEYKPIALYGWNFSNRPNTGKAAPNGRNCSMCTLYGITFNKKSDGWYANAEVRNNAATSAIVYLTLYVTWRTVKKS